MSPVLRIARRLPAMTAAGIVRPRILLSSAAEFVLNTNELQTALNHEVAHVRRRDNLKKLLLRFVAFPGMNGLETAWLEATEMAADDAAVSSAGGRTRPGSRADQAVAPGRGRTFGRSHGGAGASPAIINARVERLITWCEEPRVAGFLGQERYRAGRSVAVFAFTYSQFLVDVHIATEWLIR